MLGIPHTRTTDEFSHCAFTGKVARFAPMMRHVVDEAGERIYEVYHYGVEGSVTGADVDVDVLTAAEWTALREQAFREAHPTLPPAALYDPTAFVGNLADIGNVLYRTFNARLRIALAQHYRGRTTDLVCLPFGHGHAAALAGGDYAALESGIGYAHAFLDIRVYESLAWYHLHQGKAGKMDGDNYAFVCPNYHDARQWPLAMPPAAPPGGGGKRPAIGFFGRICEKKGLDVLVAVAQACPELDLIVCGQGDPRPYLRAPNIRYEPPIHGEKRAAYLGSLHALLAPTLFIEPWCGVAVEAQMCGTPVVGPAYGATTENVIHGKTGFLCHTLGDYVRGVRMAAAGAFDRAAIRERAVSLYDLPAVAPLYHAVFQTVMDRFRGAGWYTLESHAHPTRAV